MYMLLRHHAEEHLLKMHMQAYEAHDDAITLPAR